MANMDIDAYQYHVSFTFLSKGTNLNLKKKLTYIKPAWKAVMPLWSDQEKKMYKSQIQFYMDDAQSVT